MAAVCRLSGQKNPHTTNFNCDIKSTWRYYAAFAEICSHKHNPWSETVTTFSFPLRKCLSSYFCYKLPHSRHNPTVAAVRPVLTAARDGDTRSPRHRRVGGLGRGTAVPPAHTSSWGWVARRGQPTGALGHCRPITQRPEMGTAGGKARARALGDS